MIKEIGITTKSDAIEQLKDFSFECDTGGILIFLPEVNQFMSISFGDGSNLLPEDEYEGYVDYIYIELHKYADPEFECDIENGEIMLTQDDIDEYGYDITKAVPDAIKLMFDKYMAFVPLQTYEH